MKPTRLYYVRCNPDGSWLTHRRTEGGGHVFEHAPRDPMLIPRERAAEWAGPYELIPSPWTVETWPSAKELVAAIAKARAALGDSNDAEHDALVSLVSAFDRSVVAQKEGR